ncbi:histidine kinase [Candidatus Desantisbacteria bacterium CG1_02_38_46]|uniref:Histidine kinase n=3 Tax=unclassified Candidatus Desantisiibacteriota TaxID=3106372 RepID=A0A2H9PBB0_9BACT|nr:MAG: histidine kinase [Candidatus Desantisbacteria bacterium CG1_02_38_46]PIU51637.1 MAG: histidine kinase [Candidatus Desantisbacteria bacterium CG07_land_8_20_14_0_80_39_15]PIZ16047.1 MAG: histidine kinase [Candidatus Desantisbacteria bacterium CG_4_10_14_0_8_um_filter_39_17]
MSKKTSYARQIEALSKISKAISSKLYLEDILRLIVTVTAEVMHSRICSLMLLNEKNELVLKATQAVSEEYKKKPPLKLGEGIAGKVAKEEKPIIVPDVKEDPGYLHQGIARKERLCSLLSVPLSVKGGVIGVLNLYTSTPHKFTKGEIETLTTVANQAAVVIENARLLVQTRIIQEELETRKLVERAKGILMKQGLSEEEAFRKIQKKSMDLRKPMKEIAEAIILTSEIEK